MLTKSPADASRTETQDMNNRILNLAPAVAIALAVGPAFAQSSADTNCNDMLASAVGLSLEAEGFDTTGVCKLTIADLALIKSLLEEEGMGSRPKIELILSRQQ